MLVNDDMLSFGIIFHDVFDILSKSASELSLNDGKLLLIFGVFLFEYFFED